jgi:Na+/H+-translocating membrane pyrophosphatase
VIVPELDDSPAAPPTLDGSAPADDAAGGNAEMPVNEIVKSAQQAKEGEKKAEAGDNRTAWIAAGVGVGVGSAALVAALLYANRDKSKDKKRG